MKYFVLFSLCWLFSTAAQAQATSPVGVWEDESGEARVEVFTTANKVCGRLVWLRQPQNAQTGQPQTDYRNPEPHLRSRPLYGITVLQDMHYNPDEDRWEGGQIYDPHSGRTYSCYLRLESADRMEVKGYLGFSLLGRSHYWNRLKQPLNPTAARPAARPQ